MFRVRACNLLIEVMLQLLLLMDMIPLACLWRQATEAQVVDHVFHLLHAVLDTIRPLSQRVILEVQHREARMQIFDEPRDRNRPLVIAKGDCVPC